MNRSAQTLEQGVTEKKSKRQNKPGGKKWQQFFMDCKQCNTALKEEKSENTEKKTQLQREGEKKTQLQRREKQNKAESPAA